MTVIETMLMTKTLVIFDDDVVPGAAAAEDPSAVDGRAAVSIVPDAGSGDSGDVSLPH